MNKSQRTTLRSLMLLTAVLCLAVPAAIVVSSAGGGGDNPYGATAVSEPSEGYTIDVSALTDSNIHIYTSTSVDELKQYLTIEGPEGIVTADNYVFDPSSINLTEGFNEFTLRLASDEDVVIGTITVTAEAVKPVRLEAALKPDFQIFTSYVNYRDLVKEHIIATITYNDGTTKTLEPEEFDVEGDYVYKNGTENDNEFEVSCTVDGVELKATFKTTVLQQSFQRIEATFKQNEGVNVPSYLNPNTIRTDNDYGTLEVKGFISADDTTGRVLSTQQYEIEGSFWTGAEKHEGTVSVTLTVRDTETGNLTDEFNVEVEYVEPFALTCDSYNDTYNAGDTFDKQSAVVTVGYTSPTFATRTATDKEYEVIYPEGRDHLEYGDTYVTLRYMENGKPLELPLRVIIEDTLVNEPSFNNSRAEYNTEEQHRAMSGYDDEIMNISVTYNGQATGTYRFVEGTDEYWYFYATDAGTYTINVTLEQGYRWATMDQVVFTWTITKAPISPSLVIDRESWTYDSDTAPTIDGDLVQGNPGNGSVTVYFWGTANDPNESVSEDSKVTSQPTAAGTWWAMAVVAESANYLGDETESVSFKITRQQVQPPSYTSTKEYDGNNQEVTVSDFETISVGFTVKSDSGINAGPYDAVLTMDEDDAYNHEWIGGSWTDEVNNVTVAWSIAPAKVGVPVPNETDPWTYSETGGKADTKTVTFGSSSLYEIQSVSNDAEYKGLTVTANQSGTYTVTFILTDTRNYVWNDTDGGNGTRTYDWTIGKGTNIVPAPEFTDGKTEFTYGEIHVPTSEPTFGTPHFMYSKTEDGEYSAFESTESLDVGEYWIKANVKGTDNYDYEESEPIKIEIVKAANSIEITDAEGALDKTYDGSTITDPTYNVTDGNVHFEYSDQKDGQYVSELPSQAGTWYVVAVVTGSTNYEDDRSEPFEVTITPISIPFPTIEGELTYDGTDQKPTVSLNYSGYPSGEDIDDAIEVSVTPQRDANPEYDNDATYTLTVQPGENYQWTKSKEGSYDYEYILEWRIQPQSVSITIDERAHEREESEGWSWHPTITEDTRFEIEYPENTGNFGRYYITVTLDDDNYVWNVSKETDTDGDPYDSIDDTNRLVMKVGYDITLTRYTVTFVQNDWTYGDSSGEYSATASTEDSQILNLIKNKDGHRIEYRMVLENGTYGTVTFEVPTDAGSYQARMVTNEIPNYFSSIQSNWDDFKILPATITDISIEGNTDAKYNGYEQEVSNLSTGTATTVNNLEATWWFSEKETTDKSRFSTDLPLINAGDHKIYYYVSAPNHQDSIIGSFILTISRVELTIDIGNGSMEYDGGIPDAENLGSVGYQISSGDLVGEDTLDDLGITLSLENAAKDAKPYTINGECDNKNYSVTFDTGTFTISKINLDVPTVSGGNTTYTGKDVNLSKLIEGLSDLVQTSIGGDTITWTYSLTYDAEGEGYGTVSKKDAATYNVYIMGAADNHNPYIATKPVSVTIDKAQLSLTVDSKTVEYGYDEPEYPIKSDGFVDGESFESLRVKAEAGTTYAAGSAVGTTYDITVSFDQPEKLSNYAITSVPGKLTVIPRDITITISKNSCDYDSGKTEENDYTESIAWNFSDGTSTYNGEVLEIAFGIESNTYPLTVGNSPYDVTYDVTGDYARNYKVTLSNPEFTIKAKTVTVRAGSNNTFSYTGDVPSVNYSVDPEDARNILTLKYKIWENGAYRDLGSDEEPVNVGDYQLVITGSSSDNYTASNTIVEFKITKANYLDLVEGSNITIENYKDDYDGDSHLPTVTVTGAGDQYAYGLQWGFYIDDRITEGITNQTNGSSVTVDIVFTISEEYRDNINAPRKMTGTVTINPLTVEVKWGDTDLTYNGKVQTVAATFTDPANDSQVTLKVVSTTTGSTEEELKYVGTYTLTASFEEGTNPYGNFVLKTGGIDTEGSYQKSCTISKRTVNIVADNKTMTYGDLVPELTWSYAEGSEKFVRDGDGTEIAAGSDIGLELYFSPNNPAPAYGQTYTIGIDYSGLSGKDNYTITPVGGDLTVVQRHITLSIHEQTHGYNGEEPTVGSVLGTGDTTGNYHIVSGSLPANDDASGPEITLTKEVGVNEGKYDIYVTCNPNYVIETEGSGTDKFVIKGAEITDISVSYGGFTYDDDTRHDQSEFITSATTVNDQRYTFLFGLNKTELSENFEFSQAGHYTVYYKVTAPNHEDSEIKYFEFDGKTAENGINHYAELRDWTYGATPPTITNPGSAQGTVEIVIHIGSKDGDVLEGGFTQDTDAGTYWIEFRVDSQISSLDNRTPNYKSASESYEIEILRKSVSVNWYPSEHVYDGSNKTSTMTIKTYMAFGKDGEHAYSPEPTTEFSDDNKTVTMTIGVAGTYHAWVQLTDDNYCWSGLSDVTERWIRVSWTITEGGNRWAVIDLTGFDGWTYNGSFVEPGENMVKAEHGSVYFLYAADDNGNPDDVYTVRPFVDAGTYWIKAVVDGTESYSDLESDPKQYTITKATVTAPSIVGDPTPTYTGNEISVTLTTHVESLVYTLGTSATQVGYYQVTVGLRYPNNYMWANDGTSDTRHLDWSILPIYVPVPTYGNGSDDGEGIGHLEYNLNEQTYPFSYDSQHLNVTGNKATVKGDYTAVFTLKDTHNYAWKDSQLTPDQSYELEWRIDPMKLKVPTLEHDESEYAPGGVTNSVKGFNATYMSIDTGSTALSLTVTGNNVSLVTYRVSTELDDGQYWVIIGLKTENFVWDDADNEKDRTRTLHWKVNPIVEKLDLSETVKNYTGDVVTYSPSGFDQMTMLVNGNTGFSPGDYTATFSFRDSLNYVWSTERSDYNIPVGASVTIDEDEVVVGWSITRGVYNLNSLGTPTTEFVYDGEEHYPVFENVPSWLTITPDRTVTNASEGTVKITLTFSASEDSGYVLSETSRTYDVKVTKRPVTIVIEDKETVYGQDAPELTYRIGSETGFVDDVNVTLSVDYTNGNDKGDYDITVSHDAGDNYTVTITPGKLTVNPATVPEPTETSVLYTGSDVGHPFEGPFDVSGDTVGKELGAYTVTLTLNDGNHVWWDGTNGPKTLTWTIVSGDVLRPEYFVIDTSEETYTGREIKKSVTSRTPSIVEGVDFEVSYENNVHAGTATVIITGIGNHTGEVREEFTILPQKVTVPEMADVEYDGTEKSAPYESNDIYTVSGDLRGTDVGSYHVILTLKNTNDYQWSDGTTGPKALMWRIVSEKTLVKDYFVVDVSPEVYDGQPHTKLVECINPDLEYGTDYTVDYFNNTEASTDDNPARIVITGIGDHDGVLEYSFMIEKMTPVLTFVNDNFDRDESDGRFTLLPYLSPIISYDQLVWSSTDESVAVVDERTGEVTLTGIGTARIVATLPDGDNWHGCSAGYDLEVGETQTEIVVVPGPGGSGGDGDVIYIPTVIREEVDGGISDVTWLIILACTVTVMLALIWLLWNRRVMN